MSSLPNKVKFIKPIDWLQIWENDVFEQGSFGTYWSNSRGLLDWQVQLSLKAGYAVPVNDLIGQEYWFVNASGEVVKGVYSEETYHVIRKRLGNFYASEELGKAAALRVRQAYRGESKKDDWLDTEYTKEIEVTGDCPFKGEYCARCSPRSHAPRC